MKKCIKCGKEIMNGVNGCAMLNECFHCHGGYPKYVPASRRRQITDEEMDALENRCLRRDDR